MAYIEILSEAELKRRTRNRIEDDPLTGVESCQIGTSVAELDPVNVELCGMREPLEKFVRQLIDQLNEHPATREVVAIRVHGLSIQRLYNPR